MVEVNEMPAVHVIYGGLNYLWWR